MPFSVLSFAKSTVVELVFLVAGLLGQGLFILIVGRDLHRSEAGKPVDHESQTAWAAPFPGSDATLALAFLRESLV